MGNKKQWETARVSRSTITRVLAHLKELDLSVYGPYMVVNTEYGCCMDYTVNEIIARRKYIEKGTLERGDK